MLAPAGSIWFDLKPGEILIFSPFHARPLRRRVSGKVLAEKIERDFSSKEAFYFWVSRTITREFTSARDPASLTGGTLRSYHRKIRKTDGHFESLEKTVSFMFRSAHPALGGLSYGGRLFQALRSNRALPCCGRILEVGAGLGLHARDLLDRWKKESPECLKDLEYIHLDLSPGMLSSQRKTIPTRCRRHFFVHAPATEPPFVDDSFDLILANEVIADFSVTRVSKKRALCNPFIKKYKLDIGDAPAQFLINSGAMEFLEEARRILKPGGRVVLIEYGDEWSYPVATRLPDHVEYSIHFGHLKAVARQLGFKVRYQNLFDFLKVEPSVPVVTGNSLELLQRLTRYLGLDLPFLAYTQEMLRKKIGPLYGRIHNVQFARAKDLAVMFSLQEFKVLLLSL